MELTKEYLLYQYEELGILEGNANVKIVRNSITGKIAVKKTMSMEQLPVYAFLQSQKSPFIPEIYDYFENGQQLIVIEEYVEGRNLEDILSEQSITAENACKHLRRKHHKYPQQGGISDTCKELTAERLFYPFLLSCTEIIAHDRLPALTDSL